VATLPRASLLHSGRPTVVTVGAGAEPVRRAEHLRATDTSAAGVEIGKP
jgi:hypothetical protein